MVRIVVVALIVVLSASITSAVEVKLCENGVALLDVVISDKATPRTRAAAEELAAMLMRISGADFKITTGDPTRGIAIGTISDFSDRSLPEPKTSFAAREQYLLQSHPQGVRLIGRSELGVENATWDLLGQLGVRQFFPGQAWEVVPRRDRLTLDVNWCGEPSYALRMIWFGWGKWPENAPEMKTWERRNLANSGFDLQTGHAYETIVAENKDVFAAHPEYYALLKGSREHDHSEEKMCISNPDVQKLVTDWCVHWLEKHPEADSVSCEPSDGGGWCECSRCEAIGSPSDRALFLANKVATAMEAKFPEKYVGMYAYYKHGPAPTRVKAHPRVIVTVATSFLVEGETPEHLIAGWRAAGIQQFGIREYFSVTTWDRDLPGASNGGKLKYLEDAISKFRQLGAHFLTAESGDNWGPYGLNYYLVAKMLWDGENASRLDALKEDFYAIAFGPAKTPMKAFYERMDGELRPMLSADLIGRMYRDLASAMQLAGNNKAITERVSQLVLYTRYLELYRQYAASSGNERQIAFESLMRHAYRMRRTHMIHSFALWRDLPARDTSVKLPDDATWDLPEEKNRWKNSDPWTPEQVKELISKGVAQNKVADFTPISFSQELAPITSKISTEPGIWQSRGDLRYAVWLDRADSSLDLKVTGGLTQYRDRGNVKLRLIPANQVQGRAVAEAQIPPDEKTHEVSLKSSDEGLHWLEVSDGMDATRIEWHAGLRWTSPLGMTNRLDASSQPLVFYVPKGTKIVGGYAKVSQGHIVSPAGAEIAALSPAGEYFSVPVKPGDDGKFWSVKAALYDGVFMLLTVPPYVARNEQELLLPVDIIRSDKLGRKP